MQDPAGVLNGEDATSFRGLAARANYLALGRPDAAFACKEFCRAVARPTRSSVVMPKQLVRHIHGRPRLAWVFAYQLPTSHLKTSVDTDLAGCVATRRSTPGWVTQRRGYLLKHWSNTQPTVSLSSAEAELGGYVKGRLSRWVWSHLQISLDSAGICSFALALRRRSECAVAGAWVNSGPWRRQISGSKTGSEPATSSWKRCRAQRTRLTCSQSISPRPLLLKFLNSMNLRFEEGRAEMAPTIEHCVCSIF